MDVQDWKEHLMEMNGNEPALLRFQAALMIELVEEVRSLRMAMEQTNEPDPDAEPDPFQTLNGPRDQSLYGTLGIKE